jgi:hypothetical protein
MRSIREVSVEESIDIKSHFYTVVGKLYVKKDHGKGNGSRKAGEEVSNTYTGVGMSMSFKGKRYKVHRVVFFLHYGFWPVGVVDHINGDASDNRPDNLRDLPHAQNLKSYRKSVSGVSSKYRGVHWCQVRGKWVSQIFYDGKNVYLGRFNCEEEAALSWNHKAEELGYISAQGIYLLNRL